MGTTLTTGRALRLTTDGVGHRPPTLAGHLRRHGPSPWRRLGGQRGAIICWPRSKVRLDRPGRGGVPHGPQNLRLARSAARPTLIVNAMEGEPASAKDRFLVGTAPHLVLDGADLVATALGAARTVLCVADNSPEMAVSLARALEERRASAAEAPGAEVRRLPGRYVSGEESALASMVGGGRGVPRFRPDKSVPLSVGGHAVIVHNVETLAHVALIARYGADWFREVGAPEAPGTCLVTISGGVECPGVVEVATGTPVSEIVGLARPSAPAQAVLVGGYGGTWLSGEEPGTPFAPVELRRLGASMGAGVLVVLPSGSCGIKETERIARFMASESAGQCGPCLFGLPAIADDLARRGRRDGGPSGPRPAIGPLRCGGGPGRLPSPRRRGPPRAQRSGSLFHGRHCRTSTVTRARGRAGPAS